MQLVVAALLVMAAGHDIGRSEENVSNRFNEDASRNQKLGKDKLGKIRIDCPCQVLSPIPRFNSSQQIKNRVPLELGGESVE